MGEIESIKIFRGITTGFNPAFIIGGDKKKLEIIDNVYRELSAPSHPVSVAMARMQEIEEVKIIEGWG